MSIPETCRLTEHHSYVTEYRISRRVSEQFEAFMSGFNELIPQELINVFDERELEVCCAAICKTIADRI